MGGIEIEWRKGKPLEDGRYPGFKPESRIEDGMCIERDVAVPMRDGVKIYPDIYRPEGAPWEGWSDLYRENVALGGITMEPTNWIDFVWAGMHSRTRIEDCPAMASKYPLWNEYWEEKQARHAQTQCPAYVVASWNSRLHS